MWPFLTNDKLVRALIADGDPFQIAVSGVVNQIGRADACALQRCRLIEARRLPCMAWPMSALERMLGCLSSLQFLPVWQFCSGREKRWGGDSWPLLPRTLPWINRPAARPLLKLVNTLILLVGGDSLELPTSWV